MALGTIKRGSSLIEEEKPPLLQGDTGTIGGMTPATAEASGASSSQSKMALTPQARQGLSQKIAQKAKDTLAGSKRLKGPEQAAKPTQEEIEYTERLKKLGGLGGSIQKMVNDNIEKAAQATTKLEVDETFIKGIKNPLVATAYTSGLESINQALASGGSTLDVMSTMKNDLMNPSDGSEGMTSGQAASAMNGLKQDVADMVAGQVAAGTMDPEEVTIDALFDAGIMEPEDLGLSEDELTKGLGSNWVNMTPKQLSKAVDRMNAVKYGESDQLTSMLSDPLVSSAQKEDIKDRLWEMGYSGALQRESDVDTLSKQVEDSGLVEFGGEVRDIDDLLSDQGMETMVKDFVDGDDAYKKQFAKQNPQLAAYLEKNASDLQGSMDLASETETSLNKIRDKNKEAISFGGEGETKTELSQEALSAILPGYDKESFTEKGIDLNNPLMGWLKDNPDSAKEVADVINDLAGIDPDLIKEALTEASGDPKKMQALIEQFQGNSEAVLASARIDTGFKNLDPATSSTDDYIKLAFGDKMNSGEFSNKLKAAKEAARFDPKAKKIFEAMSEVFDADGDGKIDTPDQIHKNMEKAGVGEGNLADITDGRMSALGELSKAGAGKVETTNLQTVWGSAFAEDKNGKTKISPLEVIKISKTASSKDIRELWDSDVEMSKDTRQQLMTEGVKKASTDPAFKPALDNINSLMPEGAGSSSPKVNVYGGLFKEGQEKLDTWEQSVKTAMDAHKDDPFMMEILKRKMAVVDKYKENIAASEERVRNDTPSAIEAEDARVAKKAADRKRKNEKNDITKSAFWKKI